MSTRARNDDFRYQPPVVEKKTFLTSNTKQSRAVGCTLYKQFDAGKYRGVIESEDTKEEPTFYHVKYDDGDEEDLTWPELKQHARGAVPSSSSSAPTKKTKPAKAKRAKSIKTKTKKTKPAKAKRAKSIKTKTKKPSAKKKMLTTKTKSSDFIGCTFYKSFEGQSYEGIVQKMVGKWYHVVYTDNDKEDLTTAELKACARGARVSSSSSSSSAAAPVPKKKRGRPVKTLELHDQPLSKRARSDRGPVGV